MVNNVAVSISQMTEMERIQMTSSYATRVRRVVVSGIAAVAMACSVPATATAQTTETAGCAAAAPTTTTASGDVGVAALYKKHVKSNTESVRVFKSARGTEIWGIWGPCTNFWTDRTDGSRYHTWVSINGTTRDAWVTSSSDYIAGGWC